MLAREHALKRIVAHLANISTQAELLGKLHFFDLNIVAEDFYQRLLNEVYGYNLANLNQKQLNTPSIDLADSALKLAVQVTTQRNSTKVQSTLNKFTKHGLGTTYKTLKIVIIGTRTGNYKNLSIPNGVSFDTKADIMDNVSLIKDIEKKSTPDIQAILDIMDSEITHNTGALSILDTPDKDALLNLRNLLDRPALQDPWGQEDSYANFGSSISGLIELINTGKISGTLATKPRFAYEDKKIAEQLNTTYDQLRLLRRLFQAHVRSGEIDLANNKCNFHTSQAEEAFDAQRNAINAHFNSIIAPFGYQPLPKVN
ncbi:SMEK domain-containing protein [Aquipseudomonas campi]|uniref:SMEK domain-containing protein n=1 Tax=Aquipseudomonas campi TaxID=2731681 RepID=A0A6M8F6T5_9GAMM|nr:SMEK domain-containing protein [Pseudomonas campi]QKE61883.1 SMEK domain-containing protein [Pseudomonas campi]